MPSPAAEPSTAFFTGLLGRLRAADPADQPGLHRELVTAAYERARRLTRAIIRGDLRLPPGVETDDIVQDAMLDFSRQVGDLTRDATDPRVVFAKLCTIIRRRAVDDVRKKLGRKHRTQFPAAGLDGVAAADRADGEAVELQLVINELVADLPPADQELVNLLYLEGWTLGQVAADRGTTAEAVRWARGRVLRGLRQAAAERRGRNPTPAA